MPDSISPEAQHFLADAAKRRRALNVMGQTPTESGDQNSEAEAALKVTASHGGFMGTASEDREIMGECRRFAREIWQI